jgi:hypothetical protein
LEPAILGATQSAFIATYGPPNDHSVGSSLAFNRYPNTDVDALVITLLPARSGPDRAGEMVAHAAPDQPWSLDTAHSTCERYRLADATAAQAAQQASVRDGSGAVLGEEDVYVSATLASLFPAAAFLGAHGEPVPAGTFDILYLYTSPNEASRIDYCSLAIGATGQAGE